MSPAEQAYLAMVIGAFTVFGVLLFYMSIHSPGPYKDKQ